MPGGPLARTLKRVAIGQNTMIKDYIDRPSHSVRQVFCEQLLWLIKLRWIAAVFIVSAGFTGTSVFPLLATARPIYMCALLLLVCNLIYYITATQKGGHATRKDTVLAMAQVELDLVILTALLHFSGGLMNPFVLFYVFHVIIATIILPQNLSFSVGLSAICMYGVMAVGELKEWFWLKHYPLQLATSGALGKNPVYVLWAFVAFVGMVVLAQYLTRTIITRMRAKEQEAARNHDVLTAVINAMSEGLIFLTSQGKIALCNRAALLWTNKHGQGCDHVSADDFPLALAQYLKELPQQGGQSDSGAGIIKFGSIEKGESFIEAKGCSVVSMDRHRLGHVVVGRDLTEHKKLEGDLRARTEEVTKMNEILRRSQIEMAQREKMVALGQMASGIAHEIGNPLNSLSCAVQYLGRKFNDSGARKQFDVIERQVERISGILKHLLGLARPARNEYTWMDVNKIIEDTLSLVRFDKRAQKVTVKNVADHNLPTVWLKRQNLDQVLLNVFINALDAMAARMGEQEHVLQVRTELKEGMIEIHTSDTGVGMTEETRRRAFEPFFTTKGSSQGTGLGLYISRNLIEEISGTIVLEAGSNQGMTVIIRLPVSPAKELVATEVAKE